MKLNDKLETMIQFRIRGWNVRFELLLPGEDDFALTPQGRTRHSGAAKREAWEQACRQRWRALALCIKAKLEAVECKITTFEEEFLAHVVMPDGRTVGQHVLPELHEAIEDGRMPTKLLGWGA